MSTDCLHRHAGASPLLNSSGFCVDAAGGDPALPAGPETDKGTGHPEDRLAKTTALPDWLRRPIGDCGYFCTGIF